ncbi:MAG: sulfatase/phosphatase domain-containing protein, partial [Planctomycetota bacterium]
PARHYDFGRTYKNRHYLRLADGETIHVTDRNENDAIDFLNTRPADKPFFLTIAFFAPHAEDGHTDQYLYQPETAHLYERQAVPVSPIATPGAFENLPPFLQSERNYGRLRWHWRFDTPEKYQRYAKAYLRLVTGVDAACGRILKRLDELGLADDTLVIFTTDNGYFLGERELADKWYPYEQSIRVPLIVRDPRATRRGVTVDEFVLNVDLAPTILSAAGLDVPAGMQGRSFETLYLDRQAADPWDRAPWRTEFFYEHGTIRDRWSIPSSQAVVRKDAKYIEWPEFEYAELYDLTADPLEQRNLVDAAGHADLREELRLRLERLRQGAR